MNRLRSHPLPVTQLRDALRSDLEALPDAELLERFARYSDHEAFEALARRYGPMVFGVCRRVLSDSPDAEDAFQATFLVFIRKAKALRSGSLGPWLYGVACRVSLKARTRAARLAEFRTEATDVIPDPAAPPEVPDWIPILDAELNALPAKYREPLVLCELQGASRAEAAKALRVPEGTLSSRLARGRDLLRKRLLKHGTLLPAGGLAALFTATGTSRAAVPLALLARTFELAKVATGAAPAGAVPVGAARLTDEVLRGMFLTKLRIACTALAVLLLATIGLASAWSGAAEEKGSAKGALPIAGTPAPLAHANPLSRAAAHELVLWPFVEPDVVAGQPVADAKPARPDRDALQGLWAVEKADFGKQAKPEELKQAQAALERGRFLIAGDVWWSLMGGPDGHVDSLVAKLEPTKNPKWLDFGEIQHGQPVEFKNRCIYELDGDKLRICMNTGDGGRPSEFGTGDDDGPLRDAPLVVLHLRRDKLPPAAGAKELVGSWVAKDAKPDSGRVQILDGFLFAQHAAGKNGWIGGKYTVDATKNPKWIDVELVEAIEGGKVTKLYGSYEAVNGSVKLVLGPKRATRPLEFTNDNGTMLFDLEHVKPVVPR